jgi:hypothetical protein
VNAHGTKAPAALTIGAIAALALIGLAALSAVLTVVAAHGTCSAPGLEAAPSSRAARGIPARYLALYRRSGRAAGVPWPVLAAIGSIETDHGRSRAPGVRSGLNRHGCCAGPMQFNTRDGPPSTWERYGVDGNDDGVRDIYDPEDAIPSAAAYLAELARRAHGNLDQAILGYNHSSAYVRDVLARARAYARAGDVQLATTVGEPTDAIACAANDPNLSTGPANLRHGVRVAAPREYRALPSWALAGPSPPAGIDARLYDDALWILRRYHLRVSAAREGGHHTHGDGTALDLIPADGGAQAIWDRSAGTLARDVGWTADCARSGTRPACRLGPAIQFVGYDGYPSHGSPRTCSGGCPAHLHLSWASPCYGTSRLSAPCQWVMTFPVLPADSQAPARPGP